MFQLLRHTFLREAILNDQCAVIDNEVKIQRIDLDYEDVIESVFAVVNRIAVSVSIAQGPLHVNNYQNDRI